MSQKIPLFLMTLGLIATVTSAATLPKIHFATAEEGAHELAAVDDFVSRMSSFDRSARMQTSREVSQSEFLKFASAQALDWPEDARR